VHKEFPDKPLKVRNELTWLMVAEWDFTLVASIFDLSPTPEVYQSVSLLESDLQRKVGICPRSYWFRLLFSLLDGLNRNFLDTILCRPNEPDFDFKHCIEAV
jgi:hypothetical protein